MAPRKNRTSGVEKTGSAPKTNKKIVLKPRTSATKSIVGPEFDEEGFMYFAASDLQRFENTELKLANTKQALRIKKIEIDQEKVSFEKKVARLQAEIAVLTADEKKKENDLKGLREELQAVYAISFDEMSFDNETGRIFIHNKPVEKQE